MPPLNAMSTEDIETAYKEKQIKTARTLQSNKCLRQRVECKSVAVRIKNESDAVILVKKAYEYIAKKKLDASKMILDALINLVPPPLLLPPRQAPVMPLVAIRRHH
jgi:hypothetical protein